MFIARLSINIVMMKVIPCWKASVDPELNFISKAIKSQLMACTRKARVTDEIVANQYGSFSYKLSLLFMKKEK